MKVLRFLVALLFFASKVCAQAPGGAAPKGNSNVFAGEELWESPFSGVIDALAPYAVPLLVLAVTLRLGLPRLLKRWRKKVKI